MPLDGQPPYDLELDEAVKVTTHRPRLAAKHNPEKRYGRGNDLYGSQPGNHGKVSQDRDYYGSGRLRRAATSGDIVMQFRR
jgi:hypothetical protein